MKAKELAEKLLLNPEADVKFVCYECSHEEDDDSVEPEYLLVTGISLFTINQKETFYLYSWSA